MTDDMIDIRCDICHQYKKGLSHIVKYRDKLYYNVCDDCLRFVFFNDTNPKVTISKIKKEEQI